MKSSKWSIGGITPKQSRQIACKGTRQSKWTIGKTPRQTKWTIGTCSANQSKWRVAQAKKNSL